MKTTLRDFFYFSLSQRRSIFLLACVVTSVFLLPKIWSNYQSIPTETDFSEFEDDIAVFEQSSENTPDDYEMTTLSKEISPKENTIELFDFNPNTVSKTALIRLGLTNSVATTFIKYRNSGATFRKKEDLLKVYGIKKEDYNRLVPYLKIPEKKKVIPQKRDIKPQKPKPLTPFMFNPNTATKETFIRLGLSPKIAQTILNYRNKGGQFWKKQDFKKIYGLTEAHYQTLEPFINIPKQVTEKVIPPTAIPKEFTAPVVVKIDINQSTVADWKKLKGIGDYSAKRIVNFRDKLGGFTSVEHIKETWNVPDSMIDKVATQLIISPLIRKISINTVSAEELSLHPYIKRKEAHVIVNYRTNHGNYSSIDDLKKVRALTPFFIERITPYLSFEQ